MDTLSTNTIRILAAETVQKAKSGHPGAPMGCAPMTHVLFSKIMKYNPRNPSWVNRDRFVLSNGHGSALLYTMLHLSGYDVTRDELKTFRQYNSRLAGHPENHLLPGVEVTTGPLGQGICNAIGMAMAQAHLGARFNREGMDLFNHYVYAIVGDGCLQEGVSSEACSLAGHLKLGRLIVLYDDNGITIDGQTNISFTEDVGKRFEAYGWQVLSVADGDCDYAAIEAAIREGQQETARPTLIKIRTTIGYGASKEGTEKVHGAPIGDADIAAFKTKHGLPADPFSVLPEVEGFWTEVATQGPRHEADWSALFARYAAAYPEDAAEFERLRRGDLPDGWERALPEISETVATRKSSEMVLNAVAPAVPELVGGSCDLTHSNLTFMKCSGSFQAETPEGRNIRWGVREHGCAAICNGIAAYGMLIPYGATFFVFAGYALGAMRVAALAQRRVIYVMTHDSIGVGEDGPTHQPVETLLSLRALPNLYTVRPADAIEVAGAYAFALQHKTAPTCIALSRQNLPRLPGSQRDGVACGAYILHEPASAPAAIIIATGSEVQTALDAVQRLAPETAVRVVSAPCLEAFDEQPAEYRQRVLPEGVPVLSVEAATTRGWERYAHAHVGIDSFGISAPAARVFEHFGITAEGLAAKTQQLIAFYATRPVPPFFQAPW
eukprot:gnl/Trimastix_PCT/1304.p1 GENE.gnl/Trimastix_PCT/1304~~gnl/Trimastix_PCT/1304.p1  ORF type:complete len:666 (+),score=193.39 gnl/Trimastix_PCT/1304:55-2052(+)